MQRYETMFIINSQLEDEKIEEHIERIKALIESEGGEITNLDKWGKRKLCCEVKKQREGYYVLINFTAPSKVCNELERIFKITDGYLRYLIIREEE